MGKLLLLEWSYGLASLPGQKSSLPNWEMTCPALLNVCTYLLSTYCVLDIMSGLARWQRLSLSRIQLLATPWTVAHQTPLSMEFSRQEHWREQPFLSPGDLSGPGIEPMSLISLSLAGRFFTTEPPGKPIIPYMTKKETNLPCKQ